MVRIWVASLHQKSSKYNGELDLLFRLAQVESTAIGDGHAQLIERTVGQFRYSLAGSSVIDHSSGSTFASLPSAP